MTALPRLSQSDIERAFGDAVQAAGFQPGPIEADTRDFVRFDAPGDKKGRRNGFYKLKTGDYPVGWFGDWKSGAQHQWQWDFGRELTPKERTRIKNEQRRLKQQAEVARETRQREVAEQASDMWGRASSQVEGHPYLAAKRIDPPRGVRLYTARDGTRLVAVPVYVFGPDGRPALVNLQLIGPDGDKRFLKGGRVQGGFFSIKGDSSLIAICEGYATGCAIWRATGASVACAFNSGNLIEVALDLQRHRPLATLLVAGDDDQVAPDDWPERGDGRPWTNAGRIKAAGAAKAVGCRWTLPVFADGPARGRTDFDDLARREGEDRVRAQIFGAARSIEPEDHAPGAQIIEPDFIQDESWRRALPATTSGNPDGANVEGVALYIENHRLLRNRLGHNSFTQAIELDGNELADHHVAEFRRVMHAERFKAKKFDVADEMLAAARRNGFDPLTEYLEGLAWDGKRRLTQWLTTYLGAPEGFYADTVGRKFLVGAVARALTPGAKMDTMLVLEGPQGAGKSTALRYLFGDRFFIDHLPDFHSKDSFIQLQGAWAVEVAELGAMTKAEVNDVKQFLSRLVDKFRPPYGRATVSIPRRCVFAGTINPEEGGYLRDRTGARRFWPIEARWIDLDGLLRDRDQLWAEAVAAFGARESWYLTDPEQIDAARVEQEARREIDPWEAIIERWCEREIVHALTIERALTQALALTADRQGPRERRRAGAALRALGWTVRVERDELVGGPVKMFRKPAPPAG